MNVLKHKRLIQKIINTYNLVLKTLFAYLALVGVFGFALFIAEESAQVLMWSNFSACDTGRYDLVQKNCNAIKKINKTARVLNKTTLWTNPFQMWGYTAFHDATDHYVASLEAEVLAKKPELLIGKEISIPFYYQSIRKLSSGKVRLTAGKLSVIIDKKPKTNPINISGVLDEKMQINIPSLSP